MWCYIYSGAYWYILCIICYYIQYHRKRGALAPPPVFGRSVNPISTRGAHYPHPVLLAPRIFRPCDGPACQFRIVEFLTKFLLVLHNAHDLSLVLLEQLILSPFQQKDYKIINLELLKNWNVNKINLHLQLLITNIDCTCKFFNLASST